jgi:hypothetical protein
MRFRPGAQRWRNGLGIVVTISAAVACAPVPDRSAHSVDYFRAHRQAREARLAECERDPGMLGHESNCVNARAAARIESLGSLRTLPPLGLPVSGDPRPEPSKP